MAKADKLEKLARRARKARADSMQRHVLVCTDSDCDKKGELAKRMRKRANGLRLRETTTVSEVGCLDICKAGPICVVYPEGTWYHSVKKKVGDRIVDEHLADGEVVEDNVFLRNPLEARPDDVPDG